jgi:tetratricopeptide (TPR) repeat protein
MKNLPDAFKDFSIMERLEPAYPQLYLNRGKLYRSIMRYDEALQDFNTCIGIDSLRPEAYANRAEIRAATGDFAGSIKDYSSLLRFYPRNMEILMTLANLYTKAQRTDEAITTYTTILQIDPYKAEAYYGRALSKLNKQDRDGAYSDLHKSSDLGYTPATAVLNAKKN